MSYILRALRKSEAERAKGTVPRLTTRHGPEQPPRKRLWPALVAGALLANLGLVALVLWQPGLLPGHWGGDDPGSGDQARIAPESLAEPAPLASTDRQVASPDGAERVNREEAQPSSDDTAPPEAPAAVAPPVLEPAAAPVPTTALEAVANAQPEAVAPPPAIEPAATEQAAVEPGVTEEAAVEQVAIEQVAGAEGIAEDAVTEQAAQEETVAKAPPRPKAKSAFSAIIAERAFEDGAAEGPDAGEPARDQLAWANPEAPAPPPPPEPVDPFADVPELWRMSPAFRQSVPEMTISVHVYSPDERSRFIIIDRRKYWEGDRLDGGVLLEAILPQGVVFILNGQQFKLTSG